MGSSLTAISMDIMIVTEKLKKIQPYPEQREHSPFRSRAASG
jgi:hypothetical protein